MIFLSPLFSVFITSLSASFSVSFSAISSVGISTALSSSLSAVNESGSLLALRASQSFSALSPKPSEISVTLGSRPFFS